jgi:outer membrane receptor protein involved in Fe transport
VLAWVAAAGRVAAAAENPAEVMELGRIDVVGTTPLPGLGTPLPLVPGNVQVFTGRQWMSQRPLSLPDFLERSATGVTVNSAQGNPFQPDLSYRGFTASPLLGLPQGISVFQDGVRINEPFGDVVNWDLLPQSAIASIQLIPGAQPAFGPNTLGGALALYTKSGSQFPGGELEAYGGSWRRRALQFEQGGSGGHWDYFVTAHALRDAGWARHNGSRIAQLFAKVGYQTDRSDLDVSLTAADNTLEASQTLPRSFLDDIRQPYTYPDRNDNRAALLTLKGSRFLSEALVAGANAYYRKYRNAALASNVLAEPGADATNDRSVIEQSSFGGGAQLTWNTQPWGRDNRFVAGASVDAGDVAFTRFSQPATFNAARGTEASGDFEPGTNAAARDRRYGAFFSDVLALDARWAVTASARYNVAFIDIEDRGGQDPALAGRHRFSRLSPAAGITFNPASDLTAYLSYGHGMRAPTAIELTCADPAAPCKLPNNFLADPPLAAVISTTAEAGARGGGEGNTWSVAAWRTDLDNDIQFVGSGGAVANAGYFRNVGRTRRQGLELAVQSRLGPLQLGARYGWVDATFRSAFAASSPHNTSANALGMVDVSAGDAIPGIPRHSLKLRAEYSGAAWSAALSVACAGAAYARGDENNRDANGRVPGYAVVHLNASWRAAKDVEVFAKIDNVFDIRYANFGILGENFFTGPGRTFAAEGAVSEQFRGPGAPFGAWLGVRYRWS